MQIDNVAISKIKPFEKNPRVIPEDAVDKVTNSIREFGWQQPIVVDKDYTIVVGHTRYAAAQKLDLSEVPVHVAAELTPSQIKAYRLADNRVGEESYWDDAMLFEQLKELLEDDFDIMPTGFDPDEVQAAVKDMEERGGFAQSILDALPDDLQSENPALAESDYVRVLFVMAPDDRKGLMAGLEKYRSAHDLKSHTDALIAIVKG